MKFINNYINSTPSADWIKNKSNFPWLKLNLSVPTDLILSEWNKVKDIVINHRENDIFYNLKNKGWKSLTLYGVSSLITTQSEEKHDWTDISEFCPDTVSWIKKNFIINEKTQRIRFMLLEPGGYILPHIDKKEKGLSSINVSITQPDDCFFKFRDYGVIPFKNGEAYMIDTSYEHAVLNNSNFNRLHMIFHTNISEKLIEESYASWSYYR